MQLTNYTLQPNSFFLIANYSHPPTTNRRGLAYFLLLVTYLPLFHTRIHQDWRLQDTPIPVKPKPRSFLRSFDFARGNQHLNLTPSVSLDKRQ